MQFEAHVRSSLVIARVLSITTKSMFNSVAYGSRQRSCVQLAGGMLLAATIRRRIRGKRPDPVAAVANGLPARWQAVDGLEPLAEAATIRRGIRGKRPDPVAAVANGLPAGLQAVGSAISRGLAAELQAVDGLAALPADARRQHIHWTMVATYNPGSVQPSQMTRQQFWDHLMRCYQEAHPDADADTGCILAWGLVVREKHHNAPRWEDRSEHFHAACFATEKHYWRKVRNLSAHKYGIQLNAVAHDSYFTMHQYLRCPTQRKPLYELDSQPYFSPQHPQGDELKSLLVAGERYKEVRNKKRLLQKDLAESSVPQIRSAFGIFFNWVIQHDLHDAKGVLLLERDAVKELRDGRPQLLEFARKNSTSLLELIDYCWSLNSAEERLQRLEMSRLDIIFKVATDTAGVCANADHRCCSVYESALQYQAIDSLDFRHSLYDTFEYGRRKSNALMLVGGKDTGKTTVTQPSAIIFKTMDTPQSDSFCPLQDARGYELYLWHDFRYNPGHPKKDEQGLRLDEGTWNRLLEGLPTRIGVAKSDSSRSDFVFKDTAPFIFTGPFKLLAYRNGLPNQKETEQLACRLKYWMFDRAAPQERDRSFKHCPLCWSRWLLLGELGFRMRRGESLNEFLIKAQATLGSSGAAIAQPSGHQPCTDTTALVQEQWFQQLDKVMEWRSSGLLCEQEFKKAKHRLGFAES